MRLNPYPEILTERRKSTLINVLLGRGDDDLSPIGKLICTSAITKYRNYPADMPEAERVPHALVTYAANPAEPDRKSYDELRELISQDHNPDNEKGIQCITVYGDFPDLGACCLVDTPGAGACIERHSEMLAEFLPSADAVIMPVMATRALDNQEQELLRTLAEDRQRRIFYVLTMKDKVSKDELAEVLAYTKKKVADAGLRKPERIYTISGKQVYTALHDGVDGETLERIRVDSGMKRLEDDLSRFITANSEEGMNLTKRLQNALAATKEHLEARQKFNMGIIEAQNVDKEQILADIKRAKEEFSTCRKNVKGKLERFSKEWDRTVERTISQIDGVKDCIADRIKDRFGNAGYLESLKNAFTLGSEVSKLIRPEIEFFSAKLEERLNPIIEKLNEDMAEELNLYAKRASAEASVAGVLGVLSTGGATAATISMVTVPAIQGVMTAIGGYSTAAGSATAAAATTGKIMAFIHWLFGGGTVATAHAATATAGVGVVTAFTAAIVPVVIGLLALYLTGPFARFFAKFQVDGMVDKAVEECKKNLKNQLEKAKTAVEESCNLFLQDKEDELDARLAELQDKLGELRPEDKAQAEAENQRIAELITSGESIVGYIAQLA